MADLQEQIKKLRTLQESYNELASRVYPTYEKVVVNLRLPEGAASIDWESHAITVYDKADERQLVYPLDADGACTFELALGHQYSIGFPQLSGYVKPTKQEYAAVLYQRNIVFEYATETSNETVRIRTIDGMSQSAVEILDGTTLTITDSNGDSYSGTFNGSSCDILIPFGKICTLAQPVLDGYRSETGSQTFTTGQYYRSLVLAYTESKYGLFGVDENGTLYTIEEVEALADKTIIKYGHYNDSDLENSIRVDDPNRATGNGFYWEIGAESLGSMTWAAGNVNFDTVRLPYYSNLGEMKYAGYYMSKMIAEIGLELFPENANPTPAATACLNKTITIGGQTKNGYLPAYNQILKIATTNRTLFQSLYAALGRTAPAIWSGYWWTSCQYSATSAVDMNNGSFHYRTTKTSSTSVMVVFDL